MRGLMEIFRLLRPDSENEYDGKGYGFDHMVSLTIYNELDGHKILQNDGLDEAEIFPNFCDLF